MMGEVVVVVVAAVVEVDITAGSTIMSSGE